MYRSKISRLIKCNNALHYPFVQNRAFSIVSGNHKHNLALLGVSLDHNVSSRKNSSYSSTIANIWQSISSSTPVSYFQEGLIQMHEITGLPWWGTIICSTVLLRTAVTLPLAIFQNKTIARIELISLEMPDIAKELKRETAVAIKKFNWTEQQARVTYQRSLKKQWNKLIIRDNCHPAKTIIVLYGQIPLWIFQSFAIRNLVYLLPDPNSITAQIVLTELTLGGFGWIPNLTEVDSSLILPVTLGLVNLLIIEVQSMMRIQSQSRLQRYATNFFRILSVCMVPIASTVPSCLCLYWTASSVHGLLQNLLLMSPRVKRIVGIPKTNSERDKPYNHLLDSICARLGFSR